MRRQPAHATHPHGIRHRPKSRLSIIASFSATTVIIMTCYDGTRHRRQNHTGQPSVPVGGTAVRSRSPQRRSAPVVATALLAVTLNACFDAKDELAAEYAPLSQELADFLNDSAIIVGGLDTSKVNGLLSNVWYGRILPGNRGAIVADRSDPFLRMFDRSGRLLAAALPRGEGPEEALSVSGLAVSNAGLVLVLAGLTGAAFKEYSFESDSLRFIRSQPSPSDIPMFIVASRCGHGWAAYTTHRLQSPASIPVLAVSDRDSSGNLVWRNMVTWVTRPRSRTWGSRLAMASDDRHVYIWHKFSVGKPILAIPCEAESDTATVLRYTSGVSSDGAIQLADEHGGSVAIVPDTLYTGFAVSKGVLIESETVTDQDTNRSRKESLTVFSVTQSGYRKSVSIPGDWRVLDGSDGDLLIFGEHGPTLNPIVVLVPIDVIRRAVESRSTLN